MTQQDHHGFGVGRAWTGSEVHNSSQECDEDGTVVFTDRLLGQTFILHVFSLNSQLKLEVSHHLTEAETEASRPGVPGWEVGVLASSSAWVLPRRWVLD